MSKVRNWIKTLPEEVTMTRLDMILIVLIGLLSGMIIGILTSPKGDRTIGCNNANTEEFYRDEIE